MGENVLVQRIDKNEQTVDGIYIPDSAQEKSQEAKVIAIGPGELDENGKRVPLEIDPGDSILLSKYSGTEFKHEGETYLIIKASDILAVCNR